ncbi:YhcH/YjgK/YiaL family protein [Clostridium sp. SYSU_GA19001]|uniref:YhcH/YjgK/YiaL family protein n=1 Tax=Clostridium caldaquaticum TaxID=2940653 RepID=UPI002077251A|nr:YhcH/YjgK/YiaL family protein [Clostridium caldaquaticum]MCM8711690.1 YhcH/YjgK/YiaL family protein [Clostridium caldaquaticum]
MIIAALKDAERYCYNDKMQRAFKFLKETDLQSLEIGRYSIEGDDIFALVQAYNTRKEEECRFESHQRYMDIQFIIEGVEKMSCIHVDRLVLTENDLIKGDKAFYKADCVGSELIVHKGDFVIFYPEDGHKACIAVDEPCFVKKVVLKVSLT